MEQTGIKTERVEDMENRLKEECMKEAEEREGEFLVHGEHLVGNSYEVQPTWIKLQSIKTPREAYSTSPLIRYARIPITDEQAPIPAAFDQLLKLIETNPEADYCFNCQMGRGRTTTGMVIVYLYLLVKDDTNPVTTTISFTLIDSLLSVLPLGQQSKRLVDVAVDSCAHIQNLRDCIPAYLRQDPQRGLNYLIRYFYLIAFAEYIQTRNNDETFQVWLGERKEITNLLRKGNRGLIKENCEA